MDTQDSKEEAGLLPQATEVDGKVKVNVLGLEQVEPLTGPIDGGTHVTIRGSNLGQRVQDVLDMVRVAGVPCAVDPEKYEVSSR